MAETGHFEKGKWVNHGYFYFCIDCGSELESDNFGITTKGELWTNFCPHCGMPMFYSSRQYRTSSRAPHFVQYGTKIKEVD